MPSTSLNLPRLKSLLCAFLELVYVTLGLHCVISNAIQVWCYGNTLVQGAFVKVLMTLFNADALSSAAIAYWHSKGSKPQGRQQFLRMAEPLVKKLEEMDEESDEE